MGQSILTNMHGRLYGLTKDGDLIVVKPNGSITGATKVTTITSAQLLALNATPRTIVPAPGSGLAVIVRRMALRKAAGVAYAGVAAGEDLVAKYTDGSGQQVTGQVETTNFLDQTTAQIRLVHAVAASAAVADITPVANAAVVLQLLSGEITTGDTDLIVKVWYDIINTTFTD